MIRQDTAETIALNALTWLVGQGDFLSRFMSESGATPSDLTQAAADPEFLGAVLDFLLMEDEMVIAACDALSLPHDTLMRARIALPGGDPLSWT